MKSAQPVDENGADRPTFHYGRSYLRWLLWLGSIVIGFMIGEIVYVNNQYPGFLNWLVVIEELGTKLLAASIVALLLAPLGLLRIKPINLVFGIFVALLVGAVIGIAPPGHSLEAIVRVAARGGFALLGHFIGKSKNRARTGGLLGLLLGPVGVIIALCLPKASATHSSGALTAPKSIG